MKVTPPPEAAGPPAGSFSQSGRTTGLSSLCSLLPLMGPGWVAGAALEAPGHSANGADGSGL